MSSRPPTSGRTTKPGHTILHLVGLVPGRYLRGLRELAGKTQQDVAAVVDQSQGQVSETERRKDMRLSTLRRYVEALGGQLEIAARIGGKRIRLHTQSAAVKPGPARLSGSRRGRGRSA